MTNMTGSLHVLVVKWAMSGSTIPEVFMLFSVIL